MVFFEAIAETLSPSSFTVITRGEVYHLTDYCIHSTIRSKVVWIYLKRAVNRIL